MKIKHLLSACLICTLPLGIAFAKKANSASAFFDNIKQHCGKAYYGQVVADSSDSPDFKAGPLAMSVMECNKKEIKIPFFVGQDKSRTWVLTLKGDKILLKHDHRHQDGAADDVTMYGGLTTNEGTANMQVFPADQETAALIPYAAPNVWWITVDDTAFTYNLRRIGTDRNFSVKFDLTKPLTEPAPVPWGHKIK